MAFPKSNGNESNNSIKHINPEWIAGSDYRNAAWTHLHLRSHKLGLGWSARRCTGWAVRGNLRKLAATADGGVD
jgi:hypothetical protein